MIDAKRDEYTQVGLPLDGIVDLEISQENDSQDVEEPTPNHSEQLVFFTLLEHSNGNNLWPAVRLIEEVKAFAKGREKIIMRELRAQNRPLGRQLSMWGKSLPGKLSAGEVIGLLGYKRNVRMSSERVQEILRGVIPFEVAKKIYEGKTKHKTLMRRCSEYDTLHGVDSAMRVYSSKKAELDLRIDTLYPALFEEHGLSLTQLMSRGPATPSEVRTRLRNLFYNRSDLTVLGLAAIDHRLVYSVRVLKTPKRIKQGNGSAGFHRKISRHLAIPYVGDDLCLAGEVQRRFHEPTILDIDEAKEKGEPLKEGWVREKCGRKDVANIAEDQLHFLLQVAITYDPNLEVLHGLREILPQSLEMIFDPRVRNDLTLEQHDGPRIIADARLRTSSGDVLFEMKSHKVIYESHVSAMVEKYGSAKSWMDDKDILRKVVILNTQNGGLEKYRAMCEEAGWIVVDGDQFTRLMKQSVDLLLHREPDLFYRSSIPLQDPETTLMSITNEVYREAHVLMPITRREERKWWRKLYRRTITDLQSGNRVDQRERFDRHEEQAFDFVNAWNSHLYDGKEQITLDEDVVLLDIETSGFKRMDSQIIVIGLAYMKEGEMVTHTIHVRDPHEERAALEDFYSTIGRFEKIVTFNGKSFDLPFLHYRSAVHRIKPDFRSEHIDLLPIYRKYTGNAKGNKLQKYELRNLGVVRKGDIHGRAIGEAYQRFIQGEANHRMQDVLNHNRFDLISTAIMYHRLVENEGKLLF